jgi:predicted nucleotide-binding protein
VDNFIDEMVRIARRCERAEKEFNDEPLSGMCKALLRSCSDVERAWSRSWLGYQASVYIEGFQPVVAGEYFDEDEDDLHVSFRRRSRWREFSFEEVRKEILHRASVGLQQLHTINQAVRKVSKAFEAAREEVLPTLDAILSSHKDDTVLNDIRNKIDKLEDHIPAEKFLKKWMPKGQVMTSDPRVLSEGFRYPPHFQFQSWVLEQFTYGNQAQEMGKLIRRAVRYLEQKMQMKGKTVAKTSGKIFIGHGGSAVWRDLKDLLHDRLGLEHEEFNREATAGKSTKERLEEMLDNACFAFLVMTAEDEKADGTMMARANVIHEVGLFQGRLGFEKAIVLLEEGCGEFSNIHGLTQIRFPKGNIMAKSEEIRRVLEREGIIK